MKTWPTKHPLEVLDYEIDWADPTDGPRLVTGETIVSSTWTLVSGDVTIAANPAPSFLVSGLVTVWLTGGTDGVQSVLRNVIVTSAGRTYEQDVKIRVSENA